MKLTDLCDDILLKNRIWNQNYKKKTIKKYKSNYDDFAKVFKDQVNYFKYDTLCDDLHLDHPDDVMRTKNLIVNNLDDFEVTDFNYWPPLAKLDDDERFNSLGCFDCSGYPTIWMSS